MRPWLRFFRIRLLPTALSNVLLGVFLGAGLEGTWSLSVTLMVLGLAAVLYALGMGLNDYADRERDRSLHPDRPLPRGQITPQTAVRVLGALGVTAIGLGFALGAWSGVLTLALITAASVYNFVVKSHPVAGPLAMGVVRLMLVLLGASVTTWDPAVNFAPWVASLAVGGYVSFLTFFSLEEEASRLQALRLRALLVEGWIFAVAVGAFLLTNPEPVTTALGWILLVVWLERFALRPVRQTPPRPLLTTLRLLMALCLLDMVLLLSYDLVLPAGVAGGLWLLSVLSFGKI